MGLASLYTDIGRRRYIRKRLEEHVPDEICPPATVIVPVCGGDEFLAENLASLARQDYPDYELIVVARSESDLREECVPSRARVVFAGEGDSGTGQKINNLIAAVSAARVDSTLLAFADSDNQVAPHWLRSLAGPLREPGAGMTTGYRWHLPQSAGFWSSLRSVWNGVIAGTFSARSSFAWGGAMALYRETFHRADVLRYWRGAVSDDFQISAAMRAAALHIVYVPGALVIDRSHTGPVEFLRWIERQMIITRIYQPRQWRLALVAHLFYCGALVAGALYAPWLLALQLGLGFAKGAVRAQIARASLRWSTSWTIRHHLVHIFWTPLGTLTWLYSLLASARTNIINWRGVRYRLTRGRIERLPR